MEEIIAETERIRTDSDLRHVFQLISRASDVVFVPATNDALTRLHSPLHSMTIYLVLMGRLKALRIENHSRMALVHTTLAHLDRLMLSFDARFATIVNVDYRAHLRELSALANSPLLARSLIAFLPKLIAHFSLGNLTCYHALLTKACLIHKYHHAALPVIDHDLVRFDHASSMVNIEDFLLFYYYGGLVYCGLKRWGRAQEFMQLCVNAPGRNTSAIQVEACKRSILLEIILNGKLLNLEKFISADVIRSIRFHSKDYFELGKILDSGNQGRIQQSLAHYSHTLVRDSTLGLMHYAIEAQVDRKVIALQSVYQNSYLKDICTSEANLLKLAANDKMNIKISHCTNGTLVAFIAPKMEYDSLNVSESVNYKIEKLQHAEKALVLLNIKVGNSKEYLARLTNRGSSNFIDDEEMVSSSFDFVA